MILINKDALRSLLTPPSWHHYHHSQIHKCRKLQYFSDKYSLWSILLWAIAYTYLWILITAAESKKDTSLSGQRHRGCLTLDLWSLVCGHKMNTNQRESAAGVFFFIVSSALASKQAAFGGFVAFFNNLIAWEYLFSPWLWCVCVWVYVRELWVCDLELWIFECCMRSRRDHVPAFDTVCEVFGGCEHVSWTCANVSLCINVCSLLWSVGV